MSSFEELHPACLFSYFVAVMVLFFLCHHPLAMVLACACALSFLYNIEGRRAFSWCKWMLPVVLFIAVVNPLLNHRGVTRLFKLGNQWITLEAFGYGLTSGLSMAAIILWFACYQKVMTNDKFLYLFGKIAPSSALLITMAWNYIPDLTKKMKEIRDSQKMLKGTEEERGWKQILSRTKDALQTVTVLLGWSLENVVEQADSMKARGYGLRKRTTFHLFRFEQKDIFFSGIVGVIVIFCFVLRGMGCMTMEFYPQIQSGGSKKANILFLVLFLILLGIPGLIQWKEEKAWNSYDLKG